MPDGQIRWPSQRDIREGRAPRRLAVRTAIEHRSYLRWHSGAAHLGRQVALAVAVLCLVIASTIVHSDELYSPASGPYIGAGWGQFDLHLHNLNDVGTAVTDITHSSDDAWKALLGYRFAPFISLEAVYVDFGRPNDSFQTSGSSGTYHLNMTGFSPALLATLPLGPLEIFGKAG
jgi:hypothetical protein